MRGRLSTRFGRAVGAGVIASAMGVVVPLVLSAGPASATAPSPPFTECPHINDATSCGILIVINADGSVSVYADTSQGGPYDGTEDTLIGVLNNSSNPLPSLQLSSSADIFGFDNDGICTYSTAAGQTGYTGDSYCTAAQANGTDPQDYQGPDNTLTVGSSVNSGTVTFTDTPAGLPAGGTSYFSLEEALTASDITTPPASTLSLTRTSASTSDYNDPVTVSATLVDNTAAAITGATLNFFLGSGSSAPTCHATTDSTGTASCSITPNQAAGATTLYATYAGNSSILGSSTSAPFTVTLEQDGLSYTGPTSATNGSPLTLSSKLITDDPAAGTGLGGKSVVMTLGSGSSAQSCTGVTTATGAASCTISSVNQAVGSSPVAAAFAADGYYVAASTTSSVTIAAGPATAAAKPIPAATTTHTGEPFAGSKPLVLAAMGIGAGSIVLGLRRRRLAAR